MNHQMHDLARALNTERYRTGGNHRSVATVVAAPPGAARRLMGNTLIRAGTRLLSGSRTTRRRVQTSPPC